MSDPIRSISQNNFILADQKEVAHDNTLSGNGTQESPLGLNETVLWSGTAVSGNTVTLSESIANFDRIGFEGYCHNGNSYSVYGEAPVYVDQVKIAAMTFWPGSPEFDLVKCECSANSMTCHGTSILYNGQTLNQNGTITKVVGINRKVIA